MHLRFRDVAIFVSWHGACFGTGMLLSDPKTDLGAFDGSSQARASLTARAIGAYLGLAVGDALGATVEFMTPREIKASRGALRDIVGGGWLRLGPGEVTDDTTMSLALGQSILQRGRVEAHAVAEAFSDWMRAKPVDCGNTVRRGISRYRRTGEAQVPESPNDAGNGACMRCLPVALAYLGAEDAELVEALRVQSHVTHNSPLSDLGTLMVVRMVQRAMLQGGRAELKEIADELAAAEPGFAYANRRMENPSGFIMETLRAVLQSLFATDDFESALIDVVNRGGDSDTTGAILGMIAGAHYGVSAIPKRWITVLDAEVRNACFEQALALLRLSPYCRGL